MTGIFRFLELGGAVMLPLLIISIITITLIIDLTWINIKSHKNIGKLLKNLSIKESFDPISKILFEDSENKTKVELLNYELQKVERKTSVLSIIAAVAPLIGLLGTVFGMIQIFNVVSTQKPTNPLQSLSGGISEALFATAGGLIVAIIAGFAHHFLIISLDSLSDKSTLYLEKNKE